MSLSLSGKQFKKVLSQSESERAVVCLFRTKQLREEGWDPGGWESARTGFHPPPRNSVRIQILPQRRTVRAGRGPATRPQDRHPGGVRGHAVCHHDRGTWFSFYECGCREQMN